MLPARPAQQNQSTIEKFCVCSLEAPWPLHLLLSPERASFWEGNRREQQMVRQPGAPRGHMLTQKPPWPRVQRVQYACITLRLREMLSDLHRTPGRRLNCLDDAEAQGAAHKVC
jgi:hypothetical protein